MINPQLHFSFQINSQHCLVLQFLRWSLFALVLHDSVCFAAIECLITHLVSSDLFVEEQRTGIYSNTLKYIVFLIENIGLNIALSLKQYFSTLPLPALTLRFSLAGNIWKTRWPAVHHRVAGNSST